MIKIIKQFHETWGPCPLGFEDNLKRIEKAGRICYQSQDKITDLSYIPFCDMLASKHHYAMLEHSNLVIESICEQRALTLSNFIHCDETIRGKNKAFIYAGSYRAFMESLGHSNLDQIKVLMSHQLPESQIPIQFQRISVKFVTNRAMSHEIVRHRPASYAQLSQRYVDHKARLNVILPVQYYDKTQMNPKFDKWYGAMEMAAAYYRDLRDYKETPQQARSVLPNSTATEIVVTADVMEWQHIFKLRCAKDADPQMQALMNPVREEFSQHGWEY